jgi:hypothetical protein
VPITTTDFWNELNKAITEIETDPEHGNRHGIRQETFIRLSALLDHYSGLWSQIRKDAIDDLVRHARLIHAMMLRDAAGGHDLDGCNPLRVRDAAGGHDLYGCNPLRVDEMVSLREVLDRTVLDKATLHRILDIVSDAAIGRPVLQLRHHTERPFSDEPPRRWRDDVDDIPF